VVNRYIPPFQLKNQIWPPENAIHIIYADKVPICAVVERKTKDDLLGYNALIDGRYEDAVGYFGNVLKDDCEDEMIFYNFAVALYKTGQFERADSVLKSGLLLNPDFDPILMYLGNIARSQGKRDEAINYYERLINANRKYFEAYVGLSELLAENNVAQARDLLETCLTMSPRYKPAIEALADTYRESNPEIAAKYDILARSIK
jgi:tetratricopeptide (TPR) repeat protein